MVQPRITTEQSEALPDFAAKLERFAATCSEREQLMLTAMLLAAIDPIERMRWLAPADLLSDREEAYLDQLDVEFGEDQ